MCAGQGAGRPAVLADRIEAPCVGNLSIRPGRECRPQVGQTLCADASCWGHVARRYRLHLSHVLRPAPSIMIAAARQRSPASPPALYTYIMPPPQHPNSTISRHALHASCRHARHLERPPALPGLHPRPQHLHGRRNQSCPRRPARPDRVLASSQGLPAREARPASRPPTRRSPANPCHTDTSPPPSRPCTTASPGCPWSRESRRAQRRHTAHAYTHPHQPCHAHRLPRLHHLRHPDKQPACKRLPRGRDRPQPRDARRRYASPPLRRTRIRDVLPPTAPPFPEVQQRVAYLLQGKVLVGYALSLLAGHGPLAPGDRHAGHCALSSIPP